MSLTNVTAVAKRLATLGFPDWTAIQEPYKGADGYIEYSDAVGVECAARERLFRVSFRTRDFPVRRKLEYLAKDLAKALTRS